MPEELRHHQTCEKNEIRSYQSPVFALLNENANEKVKQDFIKKFKGRQFIDGSKTD